MNKKETNETQTATAAAGQPAAAQPLAAGAAPDAAPADAPGMEAVCVVILQLHPGATERQQLAAQSVRRHLVGVDAQVRVLPLSPETTLIETLRRFLTENDQTERIILMTDEQLLLQNVTLADVALLTEHYDRKPQLFHRSALLPLLELLARELPYADISRKYAERCLAGVMPLPVSDWKQDPWLLPVVSTHPSTVTIDQLANRRKFALVSPQSWTKEVQEYFTARLG